MKNLETLATSRPSQFNLTFLLAILIAFNAVTVLANPTVTAAILGASRLEQLDDSLAAANYAIDPELKEELDELTAEYRHGDADR